MQAEVERLTTELAEGQPRLDQARRLAAKAKEDREVFVAGNLPAIFEALLPEAEAIRAEANNGARVQAEAMQRYIAFTQKVQGLLASRVDLRGVRVPGLDAAAEFRRSAAGVDLPLPIPALTDER